MRRETREEVRSQQFGALLRVSPQAIVVLDVEGCVREWNPAAAELLGWTRDDLLGRPLEGVLGEDDRDRFMHVWPDLCSAQLTSTRLHSSGTGADVEAVFAPIQDMDGSFAGAVGTLSLWEHPHTEQSSLVAPNAQEHGSSAERPPSRSDLDELTGIPGRRWLKRRLSTAIAAGQGRAIAVLDVDGFALVNQAYGPDAGDQVLRELATRLAVQCAAVVGRWQADEFVIVVEGEDPIAYLESVLGRAASAAKEPFGVGAEQIRLTMSAGYTSTADVPPASLYLSAAAAMRAAKAQGRDRDLLFDSRSMTTTSEPGLRIAHDLQRGLLDDEMRLHFQPVVHLETNLVSGVEALLRWERPGVGLLAPAAFIGVAELTGQIVALGKWVTGAACKAAVTLTAQGTPLRVGINVSARQLSDPGLAAMLEAALADAGCEPRSIVLEVTETALLNDLDAATGVLEGIRSLGVELDLDDFGTGYSSLLYLKHFPVDRIKIDQAFVAGLGVNLADTAIVTSTIALAHSMGIEVIAEGVETLQQLALLRQLRCDYAQGYLLCHPLDLPDLIDWLHRFPPPLLERPSAEEAHAGNQIGVDQDARDAIADRRDETSDDREALADQREEMADQREREQDVSSRGAGKPSQDQVAGRCEGERDREEAAADRGAAATERAATRVARHLAGTDRSARPHQ